MEAILYTLFAFFAKAVLVILAIGLIVFFIGTCLSIFKDDPLPGVIRRILKR